MGLFYSRVYSKSCGIIHVTFFVEKTYNVYTQSKYIEMSKPLNKAACQAKDDFQHYWSRQSNDKRQARNRKDLKRIFRRANRRFGNESE